MNREYATFIDNDSVFIFEHVKRIPDASQCHNVQWPSELVEYF